MVAGYIYKEIYYDNMYISHRKDFSKYPKEIENFILKLEDFLKNNYIEIINQDMNNILIIASNIEKEMSESIKNMNQFDWKSLVNNKN